MSVKAVASSVGRASSSGFWWLLGSAFSTCSAPSFLTRTVQQACGIAKRSIVQRRVPNRRFGGRPTKDASDLRWFARLRRTNSCGDPAGVTGGRPDRSTGPYREPFADTDRSFSPAEPCSL